MADARKLIERLAANGELRGIAGVRGVYSVEVPFASVLPISLWHVVQECNPSAYFSHGSAIALHGLTNVIPSAVAATVDQPRSGPRLPLGTTPEDWIELPRPKGTMPRRVLGVDIVWTRSGRSAGVGVAVMPAEGQAVYATDPERTLIDALIAPAKSGGVQNVLQAWASAADRLDAGRMIEYADAIGGVLLRQRIGFMLELMGVSDDRLERWRAQAKRGGSARLIASRDFSPEHSERWNLSLNVPADVLEPLRGRLHG